MNAFAGDDGVEDLELAIADGLVAQGAFASAPLETLNDRVLDRREEILVHFRWERVVHQDIRACDVKNESSYIFYTGLQFFTMTKNAPKEIS